MEINVHTGLMKLKCLKTKKMFAELYKDNQMSAKTILNIYETENATENDGWTRKAPFVGRKP